MALQSTNLCRVRAVTTFISLTPETQYWPAILSDAKKQCDKLTHQFESIGYQVQSIRIVTNPFGEYLDTTTAKTAMEGLANIQSILSGINQGGMRIRFAVGEARNAHEVEILPEMIRTYGDLCNACVNVDTDENGFLDNEMIKTCCQTIHRIGAITPRGEGNFNFTVNFNCDSFIPYFPASYHRGERGNCFVVGLETPDLLVAALTPLVEEENNHAGFFNQAYEAMHAALQFHVDKIQAAIPLAGVDAGWEYIGMDTSAAPSKNCASMVDVYHLLGVPYFGAAGTVEASALLTRVFKTVRDVDAVGFSGLMLAVTEDEGLAEATRLQQFDIRALLTYSSVCGIGLDTVPIEGNTPNEKIAAVMRDTGTMAFRLKKPLTVRLFPVPGLKAGEHTRFESDDLCNCAVMAIP